MVWAIPCGLLISLTINENVLPGAKGGYPPHSQHNSHSNGHSNGSSTNSNNNNKKGSTMYFAVYDFFSGVMKSTSAALFSATNSPSSSSNSLYGSSQNGSKKSY